MNQRQQYVEEALAAYKIAGQYRLLSMRTGIEEFAELSQLYIERAWRFERYANELKPEVESPVVEEKKEMHPISRLLSVLMIVFLVLSIGSASAQDVPLETNTPDVVEGTATLVESTAIVPTAEVTVAPDPVEPPVDETPGFNVDEFLLGLVSGVAGGLAAVFGIVGRLKNDKAALDAIEWLGKSIPVDALDKLNVLGRNLRDAGEVLDKVTDGQANVVLTPELVAAIRSGAVPNTPGNQG